MEQEDCIDDPIITTNESEYEYSEDEDQQQQPPQQNKIILPHCSSIPYCTIQYAPPVNSKSHQTISEKNILMEVDNNDADENNVAILENYKWLNRFRTTTCHMFLCHYNGVEYVRNERFPADVYIKTYHQKYGNAFEVLIKDSKFYITTNLLQYNRANSAYYPQEHVTKHVDLTKIAPILQFKMKDNATLHQHIVEAMINTLFIGVSHRDTILIKERVKCNEKCNLIKNQYSWKSEDRKIKNVPSPIQKPHTQIEHLFKILYKNNDYYVFKKNLGSLDHCKYLVDFQHNVNQLKKPVTGYSDHISTVKMLIKDLTILLYQSNNDDLQNLKNIEGGEEDVDEFMRTSLNYPKGDVIFNMKTKDTNSQRYRLNCFKIDSVYIWVNSMVYSKTNKFNLESMISKYKWGTHYILSFDYMYNSFMSKLHSEVVKLVLRYIVSSRSFDLLENDIKCNPKLLYKRLLY
nr:ie-1 [Pieris rapae granulovirus]